MACDAQHRFADHNARAAALRGFNTLLDGVCEIRSACANVGAKHVRPITLVVDPHCQFDVFVLYFGRVAPDVGRHAPDGRQEDLEVVPACVEINQCLAVRNRHRERAVNFDSHAGSD